jgi:thymidylate synthase
MVVNAWAVHDLPNMVLPPCHYGFQVYTRELSLEERHYILTKTKLLIPISDDVKDNWIETLNEKNIPTRAISLMWNQRSVDTFLGLPFNIASYGLLLQLIANEVNMIPDELVGNLGDVHLYSNHIEQAKEQLTRDPMKLPQLSYLDEYHYLHDTELVGEISFEGKIEDFRPDMFKLVDYQSHPAIKAPLSN